MSAAGDRSELPSAGRAKRLASTGVALLVGSPPYERFVPATGIAATYKEATVVILRTVVPEPETQELRQVVSMARALRVQHPAVTLGIQPTALPVAHGEIVSRVLAASGLRLWLTHPPTEQTIRTAAGAAGFLGQDLETWLAFLLRPSSLSAAGAIRTLAQIMVDPDPKPTTQRELTKWIRRAGLPRLRAWRTVGRLAHGLVVLQSSPEVTISRVARQVGFADGPTFSHACRRVFGAPPSRLRRSVGWEALLHRFLRRPRPRNAAPS